MLTSQDLKQARMQLLQSRRENGELKDALHRAHTTNKRLTERLMQPDALNAELYRARAEAWERRARLAEAANASLSRAPQGEPQ